MSSDVIISVKNLFKRYRLFKHPGDRIKQALSFGKIRFYQEFTALEDVSFDVRRGEIIGIIGRNGSGKSTLLQTICGILKSSSGELKTIGRISALLELGAGFNPEFTGRENVYFQGALMGIPQEEMASRLNDIAKFADIGDFIDRPVKIYSSGMFVRLAFAVAVSVDADILVVDEALGVGDMEFRERSISRMKEMIEKGTTILFVSHSLPMMRNFCDRVIWLKNGRLMMDGNAGDVCLAYQEHMAQSIASSTSKLSEGQTIDKPDRTHHASGRKKTVVITDVTARRSEITVGSELAISVSLGISDIEEIRDGFGVGILVHDAARKLVAIFNSLRDDVVFTGAETTINLVVPRTAFVPGKYWLSVNICDRNGVFAYDQFENCASINVSQEFSLSGIPRWEGEVACEHIWH